MESFERHLSRWLTDRLSSDGAARFTWNHNCSLVSIPNKIDELFELSLSHVGKVSQKVSVAKFLLQIINLLSYILQERSQRLNELV